jgi:hypothetical protein
MVNLQSTITICGMSIQKDTKIELNRYSFQSWIGEFGYLCFSRKIVEGLDP